MRTKILILTSLVVAAPALAFDAEQLAKFKSSNSCEQCDLRGADLKGGKFAGAMLSEANLRDADLKGVDLSGANLSDVKLRRAKLMKANLLRADLDRAELTGADLSGANIYRQQYLITYLESFFAARRKFLSVRFLKF